MPLAPLTVEWSQDQYDAKMEGCWLSSTIEIERATGQEIDHKDQEIRMPKSEKEPLAQLNAKLQGQYQAARQEIEQKDQEIQRLKLEKEDLARQTIKL